jgi:hypothetical protein
MEEIKMKIYKDSWSALKTDLDKCVIKFKEAKIKHIGIYALLGDILLLKINGRLCRFNEKTHEFIEWR